MFHLLALVLSVSAVNSLAVDSHKTITLSPRQIGAGVSVSTSVQSYSGFVQGWSAVPKAFSECSSSFKQRVSVPVAVQSVQKLYSAVSTVSNQYGSCNGCIDNANNYASQYQSIVVQSFSTWQQILQQGQSLYPQEWSTTFTPQFSRFSDFVTVIGKTCQLFHLNLGNLLGSIHINLQLFSGCGLDLNSLLGGVLGSVGGLVTGLVGGLLL